MNESRGTPLRILFVCLGNICRSPMAEATFRALAAKRGLDVEVDSAGTGAWHVNEPPDPRGQDVAMERGIDLSQLRGRQVSADDFNRFDLILAMDQSNLAKLRHIAPADGENKVRLFLEFAPGAGRPDVPDPYFGGDHGFDDVLDLIELANEGLADHVAELKATANT